MSRRIRRTPGGQYASGQSGNPDGARLRKPKEVLNTFDLHRITLEVAGEMIGPIMGKMMTRYEAALRLLARGDSANRLATRDFVEQVKSATYYFARLEREQAQRQKKPA